MLISGNGALAASASNPNSTSDATGFQLLEIYLVSKDLGLNVTVSTGPGLLNGEIGSTVKHVNFEIPECVGTGNWNVTFHETSRINESHYYTITPIPITMKSTVAKSSCSNVTNQPLADASLPSNLWGKNGSTYGQPRAISSEGIPSGSILVFLVLATVGGASAVASSM